MSRAAAPRAPFEALVEAHGTAVLRVCRALVGVQDADDVWQETFLAALRAYPSTEPLNAEAWLVTIARNKAADHHRKAGRLPVPASRPGGTEAATLPGGTDAGGGDAVVHAVEAGEDAAAVWAAIGALPKRQREAVVYHHLAGLRHAEVAALLGNSEAAARRASADGMKALRARLAGPAGLSGTEGRGL
ncbi:MULTISPECIES: RNA polymerase sigma factor [unclassified Arthrobacter]|uniref:RNA polymerase sigma factor n=1 Tax=unclassified Arthrobacter TaxID=235627 RepID=UPI00159D952B|nr:MULTISPECIES: RNA polymerase sigma factor [unclassified Arthrobacter]MCQ9165141.1 RNA polymerase sigma factor [Arthrobacter sp. STN4]NVM99765.1 RNA polymerase sigma factor [Arthrobacter sp. SDTb3-6]